MPNKQINKFHKAERLVGFFQISKKSSNYLIILEQDKKRTKSTLSVFCLDKSKVVIKNSVSNSDNSIRACDGITESDRIIICTENNSDEALQWVSADAAELLEKSQPPGFQFLHEGSLSSPDASMVNLPGSQSWNVITPLAPTRWLFSPQFVRGKLDANEVVTNTADGQMILLNRSNDKNTGNIQATFIMPDALHPEACFVNKKIMYSFIQYDNPVYPFYALARYSGKQIPTPGNLKIYSQDSMVDLSRELKIGKIIAHKMVLDPNNTPWIFALKEEPVGTKLLAIKKHKADAWKVSGETLIDGEVWQLSADTNTSSDWHITLAENKNQIWILHHLFWNI